MYKHRVFVAGVIWGINRFVQWGVELGKTLAKDLTPRFQSGDTSGLDASTAGQLGWRRKGPPTNHQSLKKMPPRCVQCE